MKVLVTGGGGFLGGAIVACCGRAAMSFARSRDPPTRGSMNSVSNRSSATSRTHRPSSVRWRGATRSFTRRCQGRRVGLVQGLLRHQRRPAPRTSSPRARSTASADWSTPRRRASFTRAVTSKAGTNRCRTQSTSMPLTRDEGPGRTRGPGREWTGARHGLAAPAPDLRPRRSASHPAHDRQGPRWASSAGSARGR